MSIYFNQISHSHMLWEAGHTIQCNNFSELETPDDGGVRPKNVGRKKYLECRRKCIEMK
jgi:hypothetical protein